MKIAVSSGKGGTGKTTVAVNLALSLPDSCLFDCDVEEPNANLFLKKRLEKIEDVCIPVPQIDESICDHCGKCADFCRYNALAVLPQHAMLFQSLCHGCGGCKLICPENAIIEKGRGIGYIEKDDVADSNFYRGVLYIGEPMASPIIRKLKTYVNDNGITILDAPPGTACSLITTLEDVDYCILVTEPTPFGFHDLKLTLEVVKEMGIKCGIIINREKNEYRDIDDFCKTLNIPILLRIPYDRRIAEAYSIGTPFVEEMPEWKKHFREMYAKIHEVVG